MKKILGTKKIKKIISFLIIFLIIIVLALVGVNYLLNGERFYKLASNKVFKALDTQVENNKLSQINSIELTANLNGKISGFYGIQSVISAMFGNLIEGSELNFGINIEEKVAHASIKSEDINYSMDIIDDMEYFSLDGVYDKVFGMENNIINWDNLNFSGNQEEKKIIISSLKEAYFNNMDLSLAKKEKSDKYKVYTLELKGENLDEFLNGFFEDLKNDEKFISAFSTLRNISKTDLIEKLDNLIKKDFTEKSFKVEMYTTGIASLKYVKIYSNDKILLDIKTGDEASISFTPESGNYVTIYKEDEGFRAAFLFEISNYNFTGIKNQGSLKKEDDKVEVGIYTSYGTFFCNVDLNFDYNVEKNNDIEMIGFKEFVNYNKLSENKKTTIYNNIVGQLNEAGLTKIATMLGGHY